MIPDADEDENRQRRKLADGQAVDHPRRLLDAADVDPRQEDGQGRDRGRPRQPNGERWPVERQSEREAVDHRGVTGHSREPQQPADFETDETSERRARGKNGAAGSIEAAARFCEAQGDRQGQQADGQKRKRSPRTDPGMDLRRQQEDRAADHLVDADRGQVPLPQRAAQGWCLKRASHRPPCLRP